MRWLLAISTLPVFAACGSSAPTPVAPQGRSVAPPAAPARAIDVLASTAPADHPVGVDHAEIYAQATPARWRWHSGRGEVVGVVSWPSWDAPAELGLAMTLTLDGKPVWTCDSSDCPLACDPELRCDLGLQISGDHLVLATMMMNKAIFVPDSVVRLAWDGDQLGETVIEDDVLCTDAPSSIWSEYCAETGADDE